MERAYSVWQYPKNGPMWTTKKKSPDGATTKLETRAKSPARRSNLSGQRAAQPRREVVAWILLNWAPRCA